VRRARSAAASTSARRARSSPSARIAATAAATAFASRGRSSRTADRHRFARETHSGSAPHPSNRSKHSMSRASAAMKYGSIPSPTYGGFPVSTSARIAPSENTSARSSTTSPRACSGGMYAGVPMTDPGVEREPSVSACRSETRLTASCGVTGCAASSRPFTFAKPQSTTWTSPKYPTITFEGLRSRCTTPRACA
jgi:hypothetical protein